MCIYIVIIFKAKRQLSVGKSENFSKKKNKFQDLIMIIQANHSALLFCSEECLFFLMIYFDYAGYCILNLYSGTSFQIHFLQSFIIINIEYQVLFLILFYQKILCFNSKIMYYHNCNNCMRKVNVALIKLNEINSTNSGPLNPRRQAHIRHPF